MPITQTMTFTATPPTTGETPTTFNYNAIACWNELKLNVIPDLNIAFTEMNALETNVNAKEASAVASAEAAVSAANFKGNWSNATSYTIGDSVLYLGVTYKAILSGSNQNPSTATTYWSPLSIASSIKYTPSVEVSATTVQGAIDELSTEKLSVFNIHTATGKTTPIDADEFPLIDSASSFTLKKLTWSNIKATLKTYFDTIYANLDSPALTGNPTAPTPTAGDNDTSIATTAFVTNFSQQIMIIEDQKASGVAAGASVAGINTRTLNTVVHNGIIGASLATNQVTLPAGTYRITASAPMEQSQNSQLLLRNVTDAVYAKTGKYNHSNTVAVYGSVESTLDCVITIADTKVFQLDHWISDAQATYGLGAIVGAASGHTVVYSSMQITKIG